MLAKHRGNVGHNNFIVFLREQDPAEPASDIVFDIL